MDAQSFTWLKQTLTVLRPMVLDGLVKLNYILEPAQLIAVLVLCAILTHRSLYDGLLIEMYAEVRCLGERR